MKTDNGIPEISVILPMYNETESICGNLKSVIAVLEDMGVAWELLIIDDGSTDGSAEQARKALRDIVNARIISYQPNRGRGFALRKGFEAAQGQYFITTESDLSWGADIIPKIYQELIAGDADAVAVSPYLRKGCLVNVPLGRRILSSVGNKILTFGLPGNLSMITGMTRGYKREFISRIILQMEGKEIHLEIISKLLDIGARIKEIPGVITWKKAGVRRSARKKTFRANRLILTHLYFGFSESPFHFLGFLGLFFAGIGVAGIATLIILKIIGFSLLRIPYFPHYVFIFLTIGMLILIFSLLSSQIRNLQREVIRIYAQLMKDKKEHEE